VNFWDFNFDKLGFGILVVRKFKKLISGKTLFGKRVFQKIVFGQRDLGFYAVTG